MSGGVPRFGLHVTSESGPLWARSAAGTQSVSLLVLRWMSRLPHCWLQWCLFFIGPLLLWNVSLTIFVRMHFWALLVYISICVFCQYHAVLMTVAAVNLKVIPLFFSIVWAILDLLTVDIYKLNVLGCLYILNRQFYLFIFLAVFEGDPLRPHSPLSVFPNWAGLTCSMTNLCLC